VSGPLDEARVAIARERMDDAVHEICREFNESWEREPTHDELLRGLAFSLGIEYETHTGGPVVVQLCAA
jgi:hypothetical protein